MASSNGSIELIPLIPIFPSSISFLDLLIPVILLAASLLLHILFNSPPRSPIISAHLYRATTAHARFLPTVAKHVFSYPLLIFGVDLDELERGELDMDLVFGWEKRWCLTSLERIGYLFMARDDRHTGETQEKPLGIKEKVLKVLEEQGVEREEIGRVYLVTMPSYLGFQGINPLSVYYCYGKEDGEDRRLNAVVLEVHNTFGERHVYVLRCNVEEDENVAVSYQHQWTFPRAFHVSPFNDRTGFYCVSLSDPLQSSAPPSNSTSDTSSRSLPVNPSIHLKIVFLTPDREKKLYASLTGVGAPLQQYNLIKALLRWPLSLLLTTPRILYQAAKLHYGRRLDVFPRPEPFALSVSNQEGLKDEVNPVEMGAKAGGVGWQEEGGLEIMARQKTIEILQQRVDELALQGRHVTVRLRPADRSKDDMTISASVSASPSPVEELLISYLTSVFFVDLLTSPSIQLALEIGDKTEHRWSTSNDDLFLDLFSKSSSSSRSFSRSQQLITRLTKRLLASQMRWSLSYANQPSPSIPTIPDYHPFHHPSSLATLRAIATYFAVLRLGVGIFALTGARFVKGRETWGEWKRWSEGERKEKAVVEFGSVYRPAVEI